MSDFNTHLNPTLPRCEKYNWDKLVQWITVLFDCIAIFEMFIKSVPALAHFLPVNAMKSVKGTH